jgi:hypothetical protein
MFRGGEMKGIITIQEGDKFVVTGILYNGKRFRPLVYSNLRTANSINLWHGHGKRTLIKSVWN